MKKSYLIIVFILFAGFSFAQSKYDDAINAIKNNDYNTAINIAQNYLKEDSTDQSLKILVDVIARDTTSEKAYELLGDVYYKMNVVELAIVNYTHAEKLDSTNVLLKFKYGKALEKQESYTDAANKYLQVLALDSTYSPALLRLGEILYYAKEYGNAAYYLVHYLNYNKQADYKPYLYAANALFIIQDFKKAAEVASEGLQKFPGKPELEKIASLSLLGTQQYDSAIKMLNETPDSMFSANEYAQIGTSLINAKQDSLGIIFLNKDFHKDSTYLKLYGETVANTFMREGKYNDAINYYNKKLSLDSTSVSANVNKALCFIQLQQYDSAKVSLQHALKIKSDYMTALIWLGRTDQLLKNLDAAADDYNKILKITAGKEDSSKAEVSEAYGFFGYLGLVKKKYRDAIQSLKSAITYNPSSWQYHLWLAQAYALSGSKAEAAKEYKEVLSLDPNNADAKRGLQLLGL